MKAIVLFSGGLDSLLAMRMIKDSGVSLFAVNFVSPFCQCNRKDGCSAVAHLKKAGIDYRVVSMKDEYLDIVINPKFGRGSNMNPCIDCRILMFKKAKEIMREVGADFIITGEVLGQRPMSQHGRQLKLIEKVTGLSGFILRPLSAKLLPKTTPEKKGWVKKEILLNLSGRIRSPQIKMAEDLNINDYPCPSGGCLLTDPGFSRRIKDLMKYSKLTIREVEFLKAGRHFRITDELKLIVGRNEKENQYLLDLAKGKDVCFAPKDVAGPIAVARGIGGNKALERICASIVSRYSDGDGNDALAIEKWGVGEIKKEVLSECPMIEAKIEKILI